MPKPTKAIVISVVTVISVALGAAPASALQPRNSLDAVPIYASAQNAAASEAATADSSAHPAQQSLRTTTSTAGAAGEESVLEFSDAASAKHTFDVAATIAAAEAELGTSRATGWNQPGECIMSVKRWVLAGGGAWTGHSDPIANYAGAIRLDVADAAPGDVLQFENLRHPRTWVSGVHTILVTGVNDDGTLRIIQSNVPLGSGLVTSDAHWKPQAPEGFQIVAWRF